MTSVGTNAQYEMRPGFIRVRGASPDE